MILSLKQKAELPEIIYISIVLGSAFVCLWIGQEAMFEKDSQILGYCIMITKWFLFSYLLNRVWDWKNDTI